MKGILFSSGRYIEGVLFVTELKVYERDIFSAQNGILKVRGRISGRSLLVLKFLVPP